MPDKRGERDFISAALHALSHRDPGDPRIGAAARMLHQGVLHGPDGESTDSADSGLEQVASKVLGPTVVKELKRRHGVLGPHKL